jgi:hypothetical protein
VNAKLPVLIPPVINKLSKKPTPLAGTLYPKELIVEAPPNVIAPVKVVIFPKFLMAPAVVATAPFPVILNGSAMV